jgi:YggT family protein
VSLIGTLIQIYFYGILILAISSWIGTTNHPTVRLVNQVIDPYMKPFRSVIPPIGMIDISPMVAILVLMVARAQVLPALNGIF